MTFSPVSNQISRPSVIAELPKKTLTFLSNSIKRVVLVAALALRGLSTLFHSAAYLIGSKVGMNENKLNSRLSDSKYTFKLGTNYLFGRTIFFKNIFSGQDFRTENLSVTGLVRVGVYSYEYNAPELDTPELDTPELDTPELDYPASLEHCITGQNTAWGQ